MSRDGRIFVKGAEGKSVTVGDVARARLFRHNGAPMVGWGSFDADSVLPDSVRFGNESGAYNYGVQAAQVHVDRDTGQVKILSYVIASDCGTVICPIGAEGQVEGGSGSGIGYALTEGLQIDEGRPLNPNFPTIASRPCATCRRCSVPCRFLRAHRQFSTKGLGELNMDPTAAVINNAIFDAVGVRVKDLADHAGENIAGSERETREVAKASASRSLHHEAHEGREGLIPNSFPNFVLFVTFVVSYLVDLLLEKR